MPSRIVCVSGRRIASPETNPFYAGIRRPPIRRCERLRIGMSESERLPNNGADKTLIAWMLSLTPTERLETLEAYIEDIEALRNARKTDSQPEDASRA